MKKFAVRRSKAGLGLFATGPFKKDEFIIEYVGTPLTPAQADIRGGQYLFEVNKRLTIDGSPRTNTARYINHSCRPNAEVEIKKGHIIITAKRGIVIGEEIVYDYGKEFFNEYIRPKGCRCGAEKHMYAPRKKKPAKAKR